MATNNNKVEAGSPEAIEKRKQNDTKRLEQYINAGYTTKKGENFLYSPSGERSNVTVDGRILNGNTERDFQNEQAETLVHKYTDKGYTTSPDDDVFHSPYSGRPTPVRIDGRVYNTEDPGYQQMLKNWDEANKNNQGNTNGGTNSTGGRKNVSSGGNMNGGNTYGGQQNTGGTVAQNNQNNINDDGTIRVGPQNANLNYYQYGDDSNPAQQSQRGGMNEKYTGEGVKNSNIDYNPDITTADLDPDYLYGENAKRQNRIDAGYIARRNDMIASALYNEGLTSKEDVANFLSSQNEWMNSTEADRLNTIESVWKRLGQIKPKEEPAPEFGDKQVDEGGKIFGRASGDKNTTIETNMDPYSPDAVSLRTRQLNYQSLQAMDSYDIALIESSGASLYGETAMRDLATYDPQKYKEVQEYKKQIQAGDTVNDIASGDTTSTTKRTDKADSTVNDSITKRTESNSTERTYDQVQSLLTGKLANSQVAQTATQEMLNLKSQMAELEEKMANLPNEAKKNFRGDVPQYIVDAFVSNNAQRYQSELNKLQSRYNGAIELYKTELAQKQWEAEMQLKQDQFEFNKNQQLRENSFNATQQAWENNYKANQQAWENDFRNRQQGWTEYYQGQSLLLSNGKIKTDKDGKPYIINDDGTYTYLTDATYKQLVQEQVQNGVDSLNATWYDGMKGGQCEAFTDSRANSVYGQTMLPVDENGNIIQGRNYTYGSEKAQYVNTSIPKVGEIAIFKYPYTAGVSNAAKTYGHTMIVIGYDEGTQMLTLKGSNKTGDEKVYTTRMSLQDFRTKYYGVGFWDPTQPTWFQKEQEGAIETTQTVQSMNDLYGSLITNAGSQGAKDSLATAQTMYNVLTEIRDNGSLEHLVESGDLEKIVNAFKVKKFTSEDGGSEFANQLRDYLSTNVPDTQSQIALNKLLGLVEMKLRKESGAAISSSEWLSNFERMIPNSYEDINLMRAKLTNRDDIIKMYSVGGGMGWDEYIPIFNKEGQQREARAG